jgi:hypothetical protein
MTTPVGPIVPAWARHPDRPGPCIPLWIAEVARAWGEARGWTLKSIGHDDAAWGRPVYRFGFRGHPDHHPGRSCGVAVDPRRLELARKRSVGREYLESWLNILDYRRNDGDESR